VFNLQDGLASKSTTRTHLEMMPAHRTGGEAASALEPIEDLAQSPSLPGATSFI
jgi:hypothetical protein